MHRIEEKLNLLKETGNFRHVPSGSIKSGVIDFSSNDYLGIASNRELVDDFFRTLHPSDFLPASSASRLLSAHQDDYHRLEQALVSAYGKSALIFNSGYHANVGIIKALASRGTLFLADKLVHASIIDGLNLAVSDGAQYMRFRHNDFNHLAKLMQRYGEDFERVVIVAETVYSMDGDTTDIDALVRIKKMHSGGMLYLDEAHSIGVIGSKGLGMAYDNANFDEIDFVTGTFGKALASIGAFVITSDLLREYLVNCARSFIFSTALPPISARWSLTTFNYAITAQKERCRLKELSRELQHILRLNKDSPGHIQPLITGDAKRALELSEKLLNSGLRVLAIRTPTVPVGTERLRFSLSAALTDSDMERLSSTMANNRF